MKISIYKEKIIQILKKNHLLSITDIHDKLPDANFSTIFRNVEILKTEGLVKQIVKDKDTVLYEYVDGGHAHDHFVCDDCGDVQAIHVDKKALHIKGKGKAIDVTVHGICGDCC
jgi:Fe2+ or Zn2+ uptake regulation protein